MQHENHEVFTHSSTVLSWRVAAMHIYIQDQNMEKKVLGRKKVCAPCGADFETKGQKSP